MATQNPRTIKTSFWAQVIILAIVPEPIRWMTRWFLRRSSVPRRLKRQSKQQPGPVCDLVWYEASPCTRVIQHLSQLLEPSA